MAVIKVQPERRIILILLRLDGQNINASLSHHNGHVLLQLLLSAMPCKFNFRGPDIRRFESQEGKSKGYSWDESRIVNELEFELISPFWLNSIKFLNGILRRNKIPFNCLWTENSTIKFDSVPNSKFSDQIENGCMVITIHPQNSENTRSQ